MSVLLGLPGAVLTLFCIAPVAHDLARTSLTKSLHRFVKTGIPTVLYFQGWHNRVMDTLVVLSALTVTVEFYITVLPPMYWSGWESETSQLCGGLALCTYVTCALKDLLCAPRPMHAATPEQREKLQVRAACSDQMELFFTFKAGSPNTPTTTVLELECACMILPCSCACMHDHRHTCNAMHPSSGSYQAHLS